MKVKFQPFLLLFFATVLAVSIIFQGTDTISKAIRSGERINILIMGIDAVQTARHTDTLIFMSYSPKEQILDMFSIPRDTLVRPDGQKARRINEIYAHSYKKSKSEKYAAQHLLNALNANIFYGKVELKHYMLIEYDFLIKLVDLLGKIRVEITEPMKYDDFAGKFHIDFSTGVHYLNGEDALKFIRYRGKGSDIKRISRQQKFISQWVKSIKKPVLMIKSPKIVKHFLEKTDTNISVWGMISLFVELRDFNPSRIRFFTLPGRFYGNYWLCDRDEMSNIFSIVNAPRKETSPYLVEVWNASGYGGAARAARDALIRSGFNVVEWGNYSIRQEKTIIKNLSSDINPAIVVQSLLGCGDIINKYESNRAVDLSIIIGKDFKESEVVQLK